MPHDRGIRRALHLIASLVFAVTLLAGAPARGGFHLWEIREIYTNASGTLQFIELHDSSGGQQFVGGQQISVSNIGNTQTNQFNVPTSKDDDSFDKALLFGTAGLQAAGGPVPDFIIPNNFLFPAGGSISFFGLNSGPYTALPTDGILSRIWTGGNQVNSPQNFAGNTGSVPEPATLSMLACGIFALRRPAACRRA